MKILGMFAPGPNPSAAILVDGKLIAWAEEERFNRIKTSPNNFPFQAVKFCLKEANLTLDEIDGIAYGWDCVRYASEAPLFFEEQQAKYPDRLAYNRLQESYLLNLYNPERILHTLQLGLRTFSNNNRIPPVHYFPHHLCHVASAFHCSGFEEANVVTIDGSGEEVCTLLIHATRDGFRNIQQYSLPHSLGGFYATFTEFTGFKAYMDEGKLMGLASYGQYRQELQDKLDKVLSFDPETGDYVVNPYMRYIGRHTYGGRFTDEFVELFGMPREPHQSALDGIFPDLAFAVQWRLEQIVMALVRRMYKENGVRNVCLAGGVAMNCVMNGKIAQMDCVDDVFIQPAASDNGVSLGAAMLLAKKNGDNPHFRMTHAYWGPQFSNDEIEKTLQNAKLSYRKSKNVAKETAQFLADGKIIGWIQGRMEIGARSLGGRSILASPVYKDMKDKLNLEVKHRENWRPFCPSIRAESYDKFITSDTESPFMILAFPVREEMHDKIPSCVHVDGTARPQIVKKETHPVFWNLLNEFESITGYGILINTSFNVQGEPVVCTPQDALRCYFGTGIDILVMGDFIITKH